MAKFCTNCGEQVQDNAKFCASCGQAMPQPQQQVPPAQPAQPPPVQQQPYIQPDIPQTPVQPQYQPQPQYQQQPVQPQYQQYQQPYPPAPVTAKKNSKAPFIIAGAGGLALIALVVVLIATKGFGLLGKTGGDSGDSNVVSSGNSGRATETPDGGNANTNSISVNVPKDASNEELIAYLYIENVKSIFDIGHEYANDGLTLVAGLPYGTAAASISAMRYAVDCLLEIKGAAPAEDGRLRDWDEIAALGWASPYPYIFESIVIGAKNGAEAAVPYYEKACYNPAVSEDDAYLIYMVVLDANQLQTLRTTLTEVEDEIFAVYEPMTAAIPRSEYNFSPAYLWEQGREALEQPEADIAAALQYYRAALSLEPSIGDNYAVLAALYLELGDSETAIYWLNEGLFIDPENEALTTLYESMKEALGQ